MYRYRIHTAVHMSPRQKLDYQDEGQMKILQCADYVSSLCTSGRPAAAAAQQRGGYAVQVACSNCRATSDVLFSGPQAAAPKQLSRESSPLLRHSATLKRTCRDVCLLRSHRIPIKKHYAGARQA